MPVTTATINAVNLMRYRLAGEYGFYIRRDGMFQFIGQQRPSDRHIAFMSALSFLHAAMRHNSAVKLVADRANYAWQRVKLDKATNDAWGGGRFTRR